MDVPRSSHSHTINLIDTPGHADFTFEVLRSLRVLDGAITILDGVAGVEAQTEKVWAQASNYSIPRIIFVNKLDREGAAFGRTVRDVGARLSVWPAVCGIPWFSEGKLGGVGDVVGLRALQYVSGGDGRDVEVLNLQSLEDSGQAELAAELKKARIALVEVLAEHDEVMVDKFLEADEDHLAIAPEDITASLRRCVLQQPQRVAPLFAGASFRNVGVQPLLDAVVDLLPSPAERPDPEISFQGSEATGKLGDLLSGRTETSVATHSPGQTTVKAKSKAKPVTAPQALEVSALAFKVVSDPRRGVLVYVRVYSGTLHRNSMLWNTNLQVAERAQRLMRMYANDAVEVDAIEAGSIGVIPGLKWARTGDTLVVGGGGCNVNPKTGPSGLVGKVLLKTVEVPPPVFFVSVEPASLAEENHIRSSLDLLLREDPSLHVRVDEESGETHLSGMGELHLEIARDRLVKDFGAKARIGGVGIGYREAVTGASGPIKEVFDRDVGGKSAKAGAEGGVRPVEDDAERPPSGGRHVINLFDGNRLTIATPTLHTDGSSTDAEHRVSLPANLPLPTILQALRTGVSAALARGPTHGYPVHSTLVALTFHPDESLFANTTPAALSSAARLTIQRALRTSAEASATVLMEPVMLVTISVSEESLGAVVHDLSAARGGNVVSLGDSSDSALDTQIDPKRIYAPPDPFAGGHVEEGDGAAQGRAVRSVVARVPLKEMVGYLKHLRSLTGGRGTFTMLVDRFERMNGQRQKLVVNEMRGESV